MGNYINKLIFHNNNNETQAIETEKGEIKKPSSENEVAIQSSMQTPPTIQRTLPVDPRSVTSGISRTPIKVDNTPVRLNRRTISAIPRYLQRKPYLETDIDKVMLCLTPKKCFVSRVVNTDNSQVSDMQNQNARSPLRPTGSTINNGILSAVDKDRYNILGIDPRSPTANFDRTPILMPKSLECLRARSHENLARHGSYDADMYSPRFSYCETSSTFNVVEIQALPDLAVHAVKALGLVNYNSADNVNDSCSSRSSKTDSSSDNDNEITIIEDSGSPEYKVCKNNIPSDNKGFTLLETELEEFSATGECLDQDNCDDVFVEKTTEPENISDICNDVINVWRDSLVLDEPQETHSTESDETNVAQRAISQEPKKEVIIMFDDDSIPKDTLSLKLFKNETGKTKRDIVGKKKKVLKLQDEKKAFNSNDKNGNENIKIRTPLGNRSNNGQMQPLLSNSPQQILRTKGITPRILQENTPPHKKYAAKSKLSGTQWDPDSTVII